MKFDWRHSVGKSGERKVEAFVEDKLRFVYRRIGQPDIGIDGEIETLDTNRRSTGGLLMVQVKATEGSLQGRSTFRIGLDEKHMDYFASLVVQPILAVVSLADDAIWWKPILGKSHYERPDTSYRLIFDVQTDRLTENSGKYLRMLGERSNAMVAKYILEEVEAHLSDMDEKRASDDYDYVTAEIWAQMLTSCGRSLQDALCLLRYERRYSEEITAIEESYRDIVERVAVWREWFKEYEIEGLLVAEDANWS